MHRAFVMSNIALCMFNIYSGTVDRNASFRATESDATEQFYDASITSPFQKGIQFVGSLLDVLLELSRNKWPHHPGFLYMHSYRLRKS